MYVFVRHFPSRIQKNLNIILLSLCDIFFSTSELLVIEMVKNRIIDSKKFLQNDTKIKANHYIFNYWRCWSLIFLSLDLHVLLNFFSSERTKGQKSSRPLTSYRESLLLKLYFFTFCWCIFCLQLIHLNIFCQILDKKRLCLIPLCVVIQNNDVILALRFLDLYLFFHKSLFSHDPGNYNQIHKLLMLIIFSRYKNLGCIQRWLFKK